MNGILRYGDDRAIYAGVPVCDVENTARAGREADGLDLKKETRKAADCFPGNDTYSQGVGRGAVSVSRGSTVDELIKSCRLYITKM